MKRIIVILIVLNTNIIFSQDSRLYINLGSNISFINTKLYNKTIDTIIYNTGEIYPGLNAGFSLMHKINSNFFINSSGILGFKIRDKWSFSEPSIMLEEELKLLTISLNCEISYRLINHFYYGILIFYENILDKNHNLSLYDINLYNPHNFGVGFNVCYFHKSKYPISLGYNYGLTNILDGIKNKQDLNPYKLKLNTLNVTFGIPLD